MTRGVVGDKWSSRILWLCALGSAVGSFFATTLLLKLIKMKMKKDTTCIEDLDVICLLNLKLKLYCLLRPIYGCGGATDTKQESYDR